MPCAALFTLDNDDGPGSDGHNHVGNNTTFAAKLLNVTADLQIDSHIRNAGSGCEENTPSL
jgi:hypothetical protein